MSWVLKGEAQSAPYPGSDWLLPLLLPETCPLQGAPQALPSARRPPRPCLVQGASPDPAHHMESPRSPPRMGSSPRGSLTICSNMPGPADPLSQGAGNCLPWASPLQMLSHASQCPQLLPLGPPWFPLPPSLAFLHPLPPSTHSTPSALSPARMRSLIEAAQEQGVEFVFAISAGQDMVFSSAGDRLLLQEKLRQVPWAIPSPHCSQARGTHAWPYGHPKGCCGAVNPSC